MAVRQYTVSAVVDQKRLQASAQTALSSQTIKIPVDIKAEGIKDLKVANTTMTKLTDNVGNTRVEIDKFNASGQKLGTTIKNSSRAVNTLGQDFLATMGKVAKFGAITAILSAFTAAVTESIKTVKDFDDALTDFKKVSDLSGESLTEYTEKLGTLGETVARTRTEMVQAATEFKKSGYSDDDSAQLAQVAALYQNVADSEMSASDSSAYLISQMKAFNITADDAITIIDKTNEVSNRFAVSSTDISTALTKTSSAMAAYGNTIDETIGLTTAGTEVMTGQASKVSKGLKNAS